MTQPAPTPNASPPIWEQIVADMIARDEMGRRKYGTPLQAGNGRDALQDLYEELLDAVAYTKQAILERNEAKRITNGLAERVAAQSELLSKRAEK